MNKFSLLLLAFLFSSSSFADEFKRHIALNGQVSILAPKDFTTMPKHILDIKYPAARKPTEVLSDKTGGVTLAFNHTNNPMTQHQVREAHIAISKMFHNLYPSAKWIRDEVIIKNGKDFIVMELITPALDTQIHNIIYGTSVEGRFLLVAFNTTVEQAPEWLPVGKKIMSSLTLTEDKHNKARQVEP